MEDAIYIDQFRKKFAEKSLQMNRSAVSFSKLSCAAMSGTTPSAIVQNPTLYLAKA